MQVEWQHYAPICITVWKIDKFPPVVWQTYIICKLYIIERLFHGKCAQTILNPQVAMHQNNKEASQVNKQVFQCIASCE